MLVCCTVLRGSLHSILDDLHSRGIAVANDIQRHSVSASQAEFLCLVHCFVHHSAALRRANFQESLGILRYAEATGLGLQAAEIPELS